METIKMSELKTVIQNIVESIITEKSKKEKKFDKVMHEFGKGTLKTPQGKTVTDQKQAVAIAYSESGLDEKKEEKITESNNKTMNKISLKESDFKEMIQNIVKKVINESKEPVISEPKIVKIKINELHEVIKNIINEECSTKPINEDLGEGYTHFAIDKNTGKIVNGWDYNGTDNESIKEYCTQDLKDQFPDRKVNEFKIVSKPYLTRQGINPSDDTNWYDETGTMEEESKPSTGLSASQKSNVVKKAKSGEDIGKEGKGFKDVANKAAKEYGSKEAGERVAAASMWKNIKR